jgi:hypothetical protein
LQRHAFAHPIGDGLVIRTANEAARLKSHAQFGVKLSGNRCIRIFGRADVLKCVPTVSTVEFRKGELFTTCGTRLAISHEIAAHDHQRESD